MTTPDLAAAQELAHRLEGPATEPVVVLLNSLMADLTMWDGNMARYTDRYRVLRYDMPGHGGSPNPVGPLTIEVLADQAVALLKALGIGSAHWVGVSLGGMVAQQVAIRHPGRVLSLTAADTGATIPAAAREQWHQRIEAAREGLGALVDATLQRWFRPGYLEQHPERALAVRAMLQRTSVEGYRACAAAVRDLDHASALASVTAPTQVLNGSDDLAWTVAQAEVFVRCFPNARLTVIDGAAHIPNLEQPERFDAAVRRFIDEVEASAMRR
jgi:3-oxoadipate enol-lactonase